MEFLQKSFQVINGKTNYQSIHDMQTLLYWNSSNVVTLLGGCNHRNTGIVVQKTLYATIFPTPYVAPVEPGGTETVYVYATMAQNMQLQDEYFEDQRIYESHHNIYA